MLRMPKIKKKERKKENCVQYLIAFTQGKAKLLCCFENQQTEKQYLHNCQVTLLGFTKLRETGIFGNDVSYKVTDVKLTCCTTRFQDLLYLIFRIAQDSECVIINSSYNCACVGNGHVYNFTL